jgi:UDP:flavonoid glycosyltransferase YjiC (YdhE family)
MGPGFELARRSSFDGLVPADTMAGSPPPELERELGACQAVVCVMNQGVARAAARRGIPCVFVDCLLWMWSTPPDLPPGVPYFQESFPGAQERLDRHRDTLRSAQVVGPLVARQARARSAHADAVLVNFGGLSCSLLAPATLVTYADAMAQCAVAAVHGWQGRVVVSAGRHILERMDRRTLHALGRNVELVDLGHEAYLAELRRSRVLITSAGMHALYEAFDLRVPCLCLPSQNLSGLLTLEVLGQHGVTPSLDWNRLYALTDLDPADEAGASVRIAAAIERFSQDARARGRLVRQIRSAFDDRGLQKLQRRQARFYTALGERGAPVIAARVLELVAERRRTTLREGA